MEARAHFNRRGFLKRGAATGMALTAPLFVSARVLGRALPHRASGSQWG